MSIYTQTKSVAASAILLACACRNTGGAGQTSAPAKPRIKLLCCGHCCGKGAIRTAATVRNPELNTEFGYKNSREKSGGTTGDGAVLAFSFSQTIEYPGRIALRKAIANHDLVLAELHLEQFRLTLAARVRSLAYAMTGAHEKTMAVQDVASRTQ